MIYTADSAWNPTLPNPFTADGAYGDDWSSFLYDDAISYFSNVYPNTKVYAIDGMSAMHITYLNGEHDASVFEA